MNINLLKYLLKRLSISKNTDHVNRYKSSGKYQSLVDQAKSLWALTMAKRTFAFFTITFALIACTSDTSYEMSSKPENKSFLKVGNKEIELEAGNLQNLGSFKGNISDFVLNLFSSDFKMSNGKPEFEDDLVSGITIDLYVDSSSDLLATSYDKVSYENITENSFQALNIAVNYDFENGEGMTRHITDGSLTVYHTGSNYELKFTGTDNKGEKVSLFYEGKLPVQNFTASR